MASELHIYDSFEEYKSRGIIDLDSDTIKVALVTSSYMPDLAHDVLADVLASPSPEVEQIDSPDNGYTQGGKALTGVTVTHAGRITKWDADNLQWSDLTATFRYGIVYSEKTVGEIVNPLIGYILFDNTPADIEIEGINYVIQWSANGIYTFTVPET